MVSESKTCSFGTARTTAWSGFALALVSAAVCAQQVGSAYTYQGQLKDAGAPANGEYDLRFSLYDGDDTLVAGPIGRENVLVVDGLFAVVLDFGSDAFDGGVRFLQIDVRRGDDGGSFSALLPRQELTATPYAATAGKTVGVDGHSLDAEGGSPEDAVRVGSSGKVYMSRGGLSLYDVAEQGVSFATPSFSVNTIPNEDPAYQYQTSYDRHRFFTGGGSTRMEINSSGNVGIGTAPTAATLTVDGATAVGGTVEAADFAYNDPHERTLTVLGPSFRPTKSGIEFDSAWGIWAEPTEESAAFRAPVYLPHGALVTGMTAKLQDNSTIGNLRVLLCYFNLSSLGIGSMANIETEGATPERLELTAPQLGYTSIDNNSRAYYLQLSSADWDTSMRLYYVTITYQIRTPD